MIRKHPVRHIVKSHTRKGGVIVHQHQRGAGTVVVPKKITPKYYQSYPEINNFKFLSGDIDWKQYGASWYKHSQGDDYATVIELVNMRDAVDEKYPQKYMVTVQTVDIGSRKEVKKGLETIGLEHEKRPTLEMKIEGVHAYGGGDLISDDYGNNAKELVETAMERN
jgi:hypothetical protein